MKTAEIEISAVASAHHAELDQTAKTAFEERYKALLPSLATSKITYWVVSESLHEGNKVWVCFAGPQGYSAALILLADGQVATNIDQPYSDAALADWLASQLAQWKSSREFRVFGLWVIFIGGVIVAGIGVYAENITIGIIGLVFILMVVGKVSRKGTPL